MGNGGAAQNGGPVENAGAGGVDHLGEPSQGESAGGLASADDDVVGLAANGGQGEGHDDASNRPERIGGVDQPARCMLGFGEGFKQGEVTLLEMGISGLARRWRSCSARASRQASSAAVSPGMAMNRSINFPRVAYHQVPNLFGCMRSEIAALRGSHR